MFSLFSKKYKVKCRDGSIRFVYSNVDHAFPIYLKDLKTDFKSNVKMPGVGDGQLERTYASDIKSILMHIDQTNQSIMLEFRSAYIVYETNPCGNSESFAEAVNEIRRNGQMIQQLKFKIDLIQECLKQGPEGAARVNQILREISNSHPTISLPSIAATEMATAQEIAAEMSGDAR